MISKRRARAIGVIALGVAALAVGAYVSVVVAWDRYLFHELRQGSRARQRRAAARLEGMRRPLRVAAENWYITCLYDRTPESLCLSADGLRRLGSARGLIEALRVTVPLPTRNVYVCTFGGLPSRKETRFGFFVEAPEPGARVVKRPLSGATLALARLGPARASVVAEAPRSEKNERVRFQLAFALGEMGCADPGVLDALREGTYSGFYGVRWSAAEALRRLLSSRPNGGIEVASAKT